MASWLWRNLKYLLIGLVALVLVVVVTVLYLLNKKKQAEDLQRQLILAKANADIQYLKSKADSLVAQTKEVQGQKTAIQQEIKGLEKKATDAKLRIQGMSNDEVAKELARRGY